MSTNEPREFREITDEDREEVRKGLEQLHRELAAAKNRPTIPFRDPERFYEPLGRLPDGTFQSPLTEEERQHNEEVRRRARGE